MGLFDTVNVPCPECGAMYPAQSKSGPCELKDYELQEAPSDVLKNVNRHAPFDCEQCGTAFYVTFQWIPKAVKVATPEAEMPPDSQRA